MTLEDFQRECWQCAEDKGFHENRGAGRDDTLVRLCLIHTEVSEAAQEVKRHWPEAVKPMHHDAILPELRARLGEELADVAIRLADLAGCVGVDLQAACVAKMAANRGRPRLYGTPGAEATAYHAPTPEPPR